VYKRLLIDAKLKTGKRGEKNRFDLEKSIREVKVCILRRREKNKDHTMETYSKVEIQLNLLLILA
jgi:hypothetical protein